MVSSWSDPLPSIYYVALVPPLHSSLLCTRQEAAFAVLATVPMGISRRVHHLETGLWGWARP